MIGGIVRILIVIARGTASVAVRGATVVTRGVVRGATHVVNGATRMVGGARNFLSSGSYSSLPYSGPTLLNTLTSSHAAAVIRQTVKGVLIKTVQLFGKGVVLGTGVYAVGEIASAVQGPPETETREEFFQGDTQKLEETDFSVDPVLNSEDVAFKETPEFKLILSIIEDEIKKLAPEDFDVSSLMRLQAAPSSPPTTTPPPSTTSSTPPPTSTPTPPSPPEDSGRSRVTTISVAILGGSFGTAVVIVVFYGIVKYLQKV